MNMLRMMLNFSIYQIEKPMHSKDGKEMITRSVDITKKDPISYRVDN